MIYLVLSILLVAIDLITKNLVQLNFSLGQTISLIDNVFHLTYVRNTGAAFSFFSGQRWFLVLLPAIVIAAIVGYIIIKKPTSKLLMLSLSMIVAGGIGNLIDRIRFGYVVDFFDLRLINFPVFNVADIWVTLGATLFVYLVLFSKEEIL